MSKIKKPEVPRSLKDRGYDWIPESLEEVGKDLTNILKQNNAQCFILDVYTSDKVFRSLKCILEEYPDNPDIETELNMAYNRDTGKSFTISKK